VFCDGFLGGLIPVFCCVYALVAVKIFGGCLLGLIGLG
jgi:hypothetical protein